MLLSPEQHVVVHKTTESSRFIGIDSVLLSAHFSFLRTILSGEDTELVVGKLMFPICFAYMYNVSNYDRSPGQVASYSG